MTGSDNRSEFDELLADPGFQAALKLACIRALKKYPSDLFRSWEELASEIQLRLLKTRSIYRQESKYGTYLYKIAINTLIDAHRRSRARVHWHEEKRIDDVP